MNIKRFNIKQPERKTPPAWLARWLIRTAPTVVVEARRPWGELLPSGRGGALKGVQVGVQAPIRLRSLLLMAAFPRFVLAFGRGHQPVRHRNQSAILMGKITFIQQI